MKTIILIIFCLLLFGCSYQKPEGGFVIEGPQIITTVNDSSCPTDKPYFIMETNIKNTTCATRPDKYEQDKINDNVPIVDYINTTCLSCHNGTLNWSHLTYANKSVVWVYQYTKKVNQWMNKFVACIKLENNQTLCEE